MLLYKINKFKKPFQKSKEKKCRIVNLLLLFCVLCFHLLSGCDQKQQKPVSKSDYLLNTVVSISIYDIAGNQKDTETILDDCMTKCKEYENLFSRTITESDISRINDAAPEYVTVSDDTILLLQQALSYCQLTNGLLDITIAPVKDLWNFATPEKGHIPDGESIAIQLAHVNYKNVEIDQNKVRLKDAHAALDVGFIAKGYIADRLKEYMIAEGVTSGIINLGGNVLTIGNKDGQDFKVGIQKPFADTGTALVSVASNDSSVVTSGIYERFFSLDKKIYHHILNPSTGYPVENELLSVTILSKDSTTGDALSTSCLLLGLEKGKELIESLDGVEAVFITKDYNVIETTNGNSSTHIRKAAPVVLGTAFINAMAELLPHILPESIMLAKMLYNPALLHINLPCW